MSDELEKDRIALWDLEKNLTRYKVLVDKIKTRAAK